MPQVAQEFLNPKSMLTPGAAGALLTIVVSTLHLQFPEISQRYAGLGLSFVIGVLVTFPSEQLKQTALYQKAAFWVVNSLIIFVVGFGTNHIGAEAQDSELFRVISASLISPAYGQEDRASKVPANPLEKPRQGTTTNAKDRDDTSSRTRALEIENIKLKEKLDLMEKASAQPKTQPTGTRFFQKW